MANVRRFVTSRCAGAFIYAFLELKLENENKKTMCMGAFIWDSNKRGERVGEDGKELKPNNQLRVSNRSVA